MGKPPFIHYPNLNRNQMDFGAFSSRGGSVINALEGPMFPCKVVPGGKVARLADEICTLVDNNEHIWGPIQWVHPKRFAYIIAGIPDITERLLTPDSKSAVRPYEEIIFREVVDSCTTRVLGEFMGAEKKLREKGLIPVFATIAPMDLRSWNFSRTKNTTRKSRKTAYLEHTDEYSIMQYNLNSVVLKMNEHIKRINHRNNVQNLDLAMDFIKEREPRGRQGRRRSPKIRTGETLLRDGCHPTQVIASKWASRAWHCHSDNRTRHATAYERRVANASRQIYDTNGKRLDGRGYL